MKILVISPKNKTVFNFRGDLIKDMISKGNDVYVTGPNYLFLDDIMALGVKEFFQTPLSKDKVSILDDLRYLKGLIVIIKKIKPDLVFEYNIKPNIYGSIAAGLCRVKNNYSMVTGLGRIYTSKSLKARLIRIVTKLMYQTAFKFCRGVIFQNPDDVKEFVSSHYLSINKCHIVNGSGVNMHRFCRSEIPASPMFLMVSRIIKEKGVLDFVMASRIVKRRVPEARFVLLGGYDNSIGALTENDINEFIKDGSIEFPGEVKDPVPFYSQASVFVLPSYYREGLPRTILEGMSCGRPVITTDSIGCREPIENGVNGFLIPIKSPAELSDKMYELAVNRDLLLKMSNAAYNTCKEKYSVEIVNKQMRKILDY